MKKKKRIVIFIFTALLIGTAFYSCRQFFLSDALGYMPVYSETIGPEGGTVTDPRGASVTIPAGALDVPTEITIKTYTNSAGISRDHGVTPFTGGADFGPEGLTFNVPVTISIPSSVPLVENQEHAVFTFADGSWKDIPFAADPGSDNATLTAEVNHFSPYVGSLFAPGLLSKFQEYYSGGDSYYPFMYFVSWFLNSNGIYGMSVETDEAVYDCIGVFFDLQYTVGGFESQQQHVHGSVDGDTQTYLSESSSYQVVVDEAETQVVYSLNIQVHWETTEKVKAEEKEMTISIIEPLSDTRIDGVTNINTFASNGTDIITDVEFYANGIYLGTDAEAPFSYTIDTEDYSDGIIILTARANGISGESVDSEDAEVCKGARGPEIGDWSETTSLTGPRWSCSSVVCNGYLYVLGGTDNTTAQSDVLYAKINTDSNLNSWNFTTQLPSPRVGHTSIIFNGYLYVLGGNDGTNQLSEALYAKINTDGSLDSWNYTTGFTTARSVFSCVTYNGYLYIMGGMDEALNYLNDVQYVKINPDGSLGLWSYTTSLNSERRGFSTIVNNGYMYILGGQSDTDVLNDGKR